MAPLSFPKTIPFPSFGQKETNCIDPTWGLSRFLNCFLFSHLLVYCWRQHFNCYTGNFSCSNINLDDNLLTRFEKNVFEEILEQMADNSPMKKVSFTYIGVRNSKKDVRSIKYLYNNAMIFQTRLIARRTLVTWLGSSETTVAYWTMSKKQPAPMARNLKIWTQTVLSNAIPKPFTHYLVFSLLATMGAF